MFAIVALQAIAATNRQRKILPGYREKLRLSSGHGLRQANLLRLP
jgi:hypothetical protein